MAFAASTTTITQRCCQTETNRCWREADKSSKGLNKKQRRKERKVAFEQRLSEINTLAKRYKDSEKEFQNNSLNFKL